MNLEIPKLSSLYLCHPPLYGFYSTHVSTSEGSGMENMEYSLTTNVNYDIERNWGTCTEVCTESPEH